VKAPAIVVEAPGWLSTVQDGGRRGYRQFGMPFAGAMDSYSLALGNAVLGNESRAAVLECTLQGPVLSFRAPVRMVLTGALMEAKLNGVPVRRGAVFQAGSGDRLVIGRAVRGCRGYLCFGGGLAVTRVMGSCSTYLPGKLGGYEGRELRAGDLLAVNRDPDARKSGSLEAAILDRVLDPAPIRLFAGPETDRLTFRGLRTLLLGTFRVSGASNRVGYRLDGPTLEMKGPAGSQISGPVFPGTMQVASDGQPLLLMADAQTAGGYPRIAGVAAVDRPRVSQLAPGDPVSFREISIDEAGALFRNEKRTYPG